MPIFILLLALFVPRITIILLYLFTTWFNGVFSTILLPILGFIFLPLTLLWYSVVVHYFGGEWTTLSIIGLVVAVLIDLSPTGLRRRERGEIPA